VVFPFFSEEDFLSNCEKDAFSMRHNSLNNYKSVKLNPVFGEVSSWGPITCLVMQNTVATFIEKAMDA